LKLSRIRSGIETIVVQPPPPAPPSFEAESNQEWN